MTEFYINGHRIELGKTKITQVFQINDIGEPKDRQLNYSFPFSIPETPNNLIALEMLGVVGNISTTPYKQLKGKLVENGVEIIPEGVVTISEKSKGQFKAYILGGNVYLFDKIGSKKINELSFSQLNHGVSLDSFVNSFSNTEGYIYGISDFGKFDPQNIEIDYQVPSLYVHTIWNKIFTEAGVKYYGDIFETKKFKSKVMTMHRGYDSKIDAINTPINITATSETEISYTKVRFSGQGYFLTTDTSMSIRYPNQPNLKIYANGTRSGIIQPVDSGLYNFRFDLNISIGNDDLHFIAYFQIIELGTFSPDNILLRNEPLGEITPTQTINRKIAGQITLKGGKEYLLQIKYQYVYPNGTAPLNIITQTISNFSFQNSPNLTSLFFENYIGEIPQIAFVKDVMQEFGLIFQKRKNELAYHFIQVKTLINDRSNTLDWSKKFVGESKEKYKLSKYAQSNIFAYNYLESDSERFADGILKIDNETLSIEKILVKRPYNAPTKSDRKLSNNNIIYTPFWTIERNDDGTIKEYKPFQSKNYIAEIKRIRTTINYKLINAEANFTGGVPILDFSNLSYQQILTENYTELKRLLDFNSIKTVNLLLNEVDIQNLDLFKPIFLEQYGADFYINKIRYTDSTKPSQVELVKIKRTSGGIQTGTPSISISAGVSRPISGFTFNTEFYVRYNIKNIARVSATVTAVLYSTHPLLEGATPTGYEIVGSISQNNGIYYLSQVLIVDDAISGWYKISMEQNGVQSNVVYVLY